MPGLPEGTVSLLFTDIEGSTRLQQRLGERYQEVVSEHRRLLEQAIEAHGGRIVDRQTESFFAAFPRAHQAVDAAASAQRAFAEHAWPDGMQVKARIGIHAGEPELVGDRYVGLAVSRAARICASAHGGQVLLSSAARALLSDDERTSLRHLGSYRLKDFAQPEPLSQLVVDGLPSRFPPLRTGAAPSRRRRLLVALAALGLAGGIAGAAVALTGGSSSLSRIGPLSMGVIDPKTNRITAEIRLGFRSSLIAAGDGFVWVVDPQGATLRKIDPRTHETTSFGIAAGAGAVPFGIAVGGGAVWLALAEGARQELLELGAENGEPLRRISFGAGSAFLLYGLHPLAVGAGAVWAIDSSVGGIWRIGLAGGKARRLADGLDALAIEVADGAVWVAGRSTVTKIDSTAGQMLGSAPVGAATSAETSSIAVGNGAVWVAVSSGDSVARIDEESVATTKTFPVGRGPTGIALDDGAVWVANSRDGTITRLDPGRGRTTTIELGHPPGGIVAAYGAVWTSPGEPRS